MKKLYKKEKEKEKENMKKFFKGKKNHYVAFNLVKS